MFIHSIHIYIYVCKYMSACNINLCKEKKQILYVNMHVCVYIYIHAHTYV